MKVSGFEEWGILVGVFVHGQECLGVIKTPVFCVLLDLQIGLEVPCMCH